MRIKYLDLKTNKEVIHYSLLECGFAIFPQIVIKGESFRCLGNMKYDMAAALILLAGV